MSAQNTNSGFRWMLHGVEGFSSHVLTVISSLDSTGYDNNKEHATVKYKAIYGFFFM
jgi:hypothetical protein